MTIEVALVPVLAASNSFNLQPDSRLILAANSSAPHRRLTLCG
jgi:hypothetical protein